MSNENAFIELAKFAASRHDQRRQHEWKTSFAFWALLVGAMAKGKDIIKLNSWELLGFCGAVFLFYTFVWVRGLYIANKNDKELSEYFWKKAMVELGISVSGTDNVPEKIEWKSDKYLFALFADWAMLFHLMVTVVLILVLYFQLTSS